MDTIGEIGVILDVHSVFLKEVLQVKVSTKGRYGLTIMMDLALHYGKGPISLKSIAERHDLSENYLEQLIAPLRNAGLVRSIRGAYGGYKLAKKPEKITVAEIMLILEGPISSVDINEEQDPARRDLWRRVQKAIMEVLDNTTLADLVQYKDEDNQDPYMFYI